MKGNVEGKVKGKLFDIKVYTREGEFFYQKVPVHKLTEDKLIFGKKSHLVALSTTYDSGVTYSIVEAVQQTKEENTVEGMLQDWKDSDPLYGLDNLESSVKLKEVLQLLAMNGYTKP